MQNIIRAVGNLPITFWGILVLFASMWIAVHYNKETGYYFAGVGSTLCGINHLVRPNPQEATSNASDQASNT